MAVSDPVADMLTRIRNAAKAQKPTVEIPSSNLKVELAKKFEMYGFVKKFVVLEDSKQGIIKMLLNYKEGKSVIQGVERVSKPGRRVYSSSEEIPRALNGLGFFLVSTSKGILSDHECRRQNVGGEILCKVW
jgi:small subunit ribosomal protein S8